MVAKASTSRKRANPLVKPKSDDYSEQKAAAAQRPALGRGNVPDVPDTPARSVTTVLVSLATSLATVAVVAVAYALLRRSAAPMSAVDDLSERVQLMSRELQRNQFLGQLAGSIDLDELMARTLEAAGALPGVDAASIEVAGLDGQTIVQVGGMTTHEAAEHAFSAPAAGAGLRVLAMSYEPAEENAIAGGLAVPIEGETGPIGLLSVFTRSRLERIRQLDVELESLAVRAGPSLDNARRFREARQLADLDALTALHNRRYFHETLAREVSRAHRYDRRLALIVFDLDDFKAINDRVGHLAGDAVLADLAERVQEVVRSADVACRIGGDEFAVILPEATLEDAVQLYSRLRRAIASRPNVHAGQMTVSAGMAELRCEDDPTMFFQRADEALYRAKGDGKGRAVGSA